MSWFDATGIASLAKTALKEAQKTIDKALDIKEDEDSTDFGKTTTSASELSIESIDSLSPDSERSATDKKKMKQSISNPIISSVTTGTAASNLWGSFTGSFFDTTSASDDRTKPAVTIAPTSSREAVLLAKKNEKIAASAVNTARPSSNISGRTSSASASESVEMLSSPLTPSSSLTSPSVNCPQISSPSYTTLQHSHTPSESIEIISQTIDITNASNSNALSADGALNSISCTSISESVEIIDDGQVTPQNLSISTEEVLTHLNDNDDEDSASVSCNTLSESTAPVTVLSTRSDEQIVSITSPPNRAAMTLNFGAIRKQTSTSKLVKGKSLAASIEECKSKAPETHLEKPFSEGFETQTELSDSTQSFEDVQQILMEEQSANRQRNSTRESSSSPQSNDDKNDLTKMAAVAVEHHSGHTSADEFETTTSSDIEIISAPNGDSSSTNSIAGIAACKLSSKNSDLLSPAGSHSQYVIFEGASSSKKKRHHRELSEASTYSMQSESGSEGCSHSVFEIEKLVRRIAELNEVIEVREFKLVELGRNNAELHEINAELKHQVETLQRRADTQGMTSATEEHTERMSALERKFQQTLRERDAARAELKNIQLVLSKSVPRDEIDRLMKEKDTMVDELRLEGEKLSKQILQHSNIIKKLRAKEKESDVLIKNQTEQIDQLTSELERSKKSLSAKDEMERTQMEAVHKLTSEKQKLAKELLQVKSELNDTTEKLKTLRTSFDAAKKELNEKQQEHQSLTQKTKDLNSLQDERQILQQQNQQLLQEVEMMREKLKLNANEQTNQQQKLRQENAMLVRRLEEIEQRNEEQAQAITTATIPLVKQCEALQSTLNARTSAWEKQESALLKQIETLEKRLANVSAVEQTASEQSDQLMSKIQNLEEALTKALLQSEQTATSLQQKQMELELLQSDFKTREARDREIISQYEENERQLNAKLSEAQRQMKDTYEQRRKSSEADARNKQITSSESMDEAQSDNGFDGEQERRELKAELSRIERNASPSPPLSAGKNSVDDLMTSTAWPFDDMDSVSNAGGAVGRPSISSMYGPGSFSFGGNSALIETLQSSLKQRDGENHQLQWELSRLQSERHFLMNELSTSNSELEAIREKLSKHDTIVSQFTELQEQYDAILQMYGEKVEETQELQLDLQDVKDMYRAQIDDLLVQQRQLQQQLHELKEQRK